MIALNEAVILGHLGADPEVRTFDDGGKIATISVATSNTWTDKGGVKQESTEWHRVVFRGELAVVAEKYLKKGSKVYIKGSMKTRKYIDQAGVGQYITEIIGLKLNMLDGGQQNISQPNQVAQQNHTNDKKEPPQQQEQAAVINKNLDEIDDSIPFSI